MNTPPDTYTAKNLYDDVCALVETARKMRLEETDPSLKEDLTLAFDSLRSARLYLSLHIDKEDRDHEQ